VNRTCHILMESCLKLNVFINSLFSFYLSLTLNALILNNIFIYFGKSCHFLLQKIQSTFHLATPVVLSKPSSVLSDPSSVTGSGQFQPNQNWFGKKQTNLLQYPNQNNSKTRLDKLFDFCLIEF